MENPLGSSVSLILYRKDGRMRILSFFWLKHQIKKRSNNNANKDDKFHKSEALKYKERQRNNNFFRVSGLKQIEIVHKGSTIRKGVCFKA